ETPAPPPAGGPRRPPARPRPGVPRPGVPQPGSLELRGQERAVLDAVCGSGDAERAGWLARFAAARQAAAQAAGAGAGSSPDAHVVAATQETITVALGERSCELQHRELHSPDGVPPRRCAVAWTWGPGSGAPPRPDVSVLLPPGEATEEETAQ
ncbi:MAG: hypothetical protein ACLP52_25970, partial [Streptosporangiaceae bacterium]